MQMISENVSTFAADIQRLAKRTIPNWAGTIEADIVMKKKMIVKCHHKRISSMAQ